MTSKIGGQLSVRTANRARKRKIGKPYMPYELKSVGFWTDEEEKKTSSKNIK